MRQLIVKQLDYELTPVAGLALVGRYLLAFQPTLARLDAALPIKGGVAHSGLDPVPWTPRSAMSVIHGRPVRSLATNRWPAVNG